MMTDIKKLKDDCIQSITRLHDVAAYKRCECEETQELDKLKAQLTKETYEVLGKIALRLSKMPWENCTNPHKLNEEIFISESINMLLDDLTGCGGCNEL